MMSPLGNLNVIYIVVPKLIEALIGHFVYFLFPVSDPRDRWMQDGICALFADIIASAKFSPSFRLERRWNDLNWLMVEDIHPSIVLGTVDPITNEPFYDKFLRTKAKLLMNMITMSLKSTDQQLIFLMEPHMKQSYEPNSGFVTESFMQELVRFCPQINFSAFRHQWLLSNGFPIFTYNFTNDVRHNNIKLVLAQTPSAKTRIPFFTGQMLVHLQDLDQPYDFPFPVENQIQLQQLQYFAHRRKTKIKEFAFANSRTEKVQVHQAVLWMTIDAPGTWICRVRPRLPEFMITHQFQLLWNVFAQHEAVSSMEDFAGTDKTLAQMEDLLKKPEIYYGVRCHAARALARFNSEQGESKHMTILLKWYTSEFFETVQGKNVLKPHDFHDAGRHFVQLEVIKAMSIIRDGQNYTPRQIVELLLHIFDKANNSTSNMYNADSYNAEVEMALGRIRPEDDQRYNDAANNILGKLRLHATIPSFCNITSSAGYLALTAISLKTDTYLPPVPEMRAVVLENTNYFEARASVFRDLLFLALYEKGVGFDELIAHLKSLVLDGHREMAALCFRELHRFVLNSPHIGDDNRFQTYLLALPEDMTREDLVAVITGGEHRLEIVETIWEIMTVHAQHHKILRAEAYRAYLTLYGDKLPAPYIERGGSVAQHELSADRSAGCRVHIDVPRTMSRTQSMHLGRDGPGFGGPKKTKLTIPEPPAPGTLGPASPRMVKSPSMGIVQ
jgi:transcription initiation factor TFIID subunit 2